ncbi:MULTISPECIES: helix-turn-helix transcriptional regulator [Vibrio]|uniref:AlpA family transcriptional regulator n=1 Tax=Vibrio parahaemolyticus TaxID=670 RepID=A0AAW8Q3U9_VIBPH|nr:MULTISPECIES: AlpA family transcriptional regulator [Vibrio]MCZ5868651.1 AlpA family transcriptional regulator [Vibrio parahaemolyticus]MCZ5899232.1 AlpA family transcriptional regulator [Vibrio parahaemolyticus]MCZ6022516.1 AlpA family transcriptional regulator [Vibrio parahaemolyticus]MCZ6248408.1 AlpA family transcriptional regulator [Vibrio parahaemolyticus]MCZ6307280.1 AlpA family transcriptional regulator [Vibrio parahaemolyticus]
MYLLTLKEVMHLTGLRRSSIYKFMEEGHFPKSVSIGGRSVMWSEEDVQSWILKRITLRNLLGE